MSRKGDPVAGKRVVVDLQQIELLEQRVIKATETIRALRREREALQAKAAQAEHAVAEARRAAADAERERAALMEGAEELDMLREERQAIRGRVDRMLELMAALDENPAENRSDH